ncbi:hypothetical protein SMGD1_2298 [Sulfurimonas gotlandica GD1]|uniref:Uncharacterized protein n=1 Tax=Sulfurimonas gotlandica (strain DSM 19862 / JCM 16533 / GD1) TaxID=929558 RepID=B6BMR2_SULGG|nr:hypothetical protein [Sulfurimonas gotlandica]EDZ61662.1 conserved hypothetical protein [Sulfurimonas gotlandica GD1]EHP30821.1 hypothetical protein SMGD1_2298 [Sulfurimonas gotlandica GD1]
MSKKTEHSFSSVISVNPYKDTYLSGISSFLSQTNSPEFSKEQYAISYLNTKGFINSQISISKNIPEEDLHDAINNKVYDELALDQAVTYQIQFIETFNSLDEDNRNFHVFIIDPLTIEETFSIVTSKIKYIDTIIPSPLLLKSLYEKEIIETGGVHCFIYFQENDAFITVYSEKEFLYTKSINYSFLQMHERFCELYGERVEFENFIEFFSEHNLKETNSDYKEYFIKLYKEIFANANDILTYVKRAYELEKIEHVYIGSQIQTVTKLDEMTEVELGIKSSNFEFNYGFESDGAYIDQLHALMHIYTTLPKDEKYDCNFTTYHRPPKFMQRESGKIILLSVASLVLAFMYPVTYWVLTYAQTLQYDLLSTEYTELHNIKITRQATLKNREADKAKVLTLLDKEIKDYSEKKATLIKIHDVKVNYPMKAKLLSVLTKDLNKFNINIDSLSYKEDEKLKTFTLNLISEKDKKITEMIEYLTKIHEGKFNFSLEHIEFKEKSKKYFSELKVSIL